MMAGTGHKPPVHMIKLTEEREFTPTFGCIQTKLDDQP